MGKIFWAIVVTDAALFIALLISGLTAPAPPDGGREMGLTFGVILPGLLVALAVATYVLTSSPALRVAALGIVAGPGLLIAGAHLRNAWIDRQVRQNALGRGYFSERALKDLGEAVVRRDLATVEMGAPTVDVNSHGASGMTPLRLAVEEAFEAPTRLKPFPSELPIIHALLRRGADPNPGLEVSTKIQDPAILRALLAAGANPILTVSGSPVAFVWMNVMPAENLKLLVECGANIQAVDRFGTPLILKAAEEENWPAVIYLAQRGADVRQPDRHGRTLATLIADRLASLKQSGREIPPGLLEVKNLLHLPLSPNT